MCRDMGRDVVGDMRGHSLSHGSRTSMPGLSASGEQVHHLLGRHMSMHMPIHVSTHAPTVCEQASKLLGHNYIGHYYIGE